MLFSVIVPVYNSELYLKRCLDSILNQSYDNFEVILIDDGSTDNSDIICDKYAALDKRFHVEHYDNGGVVKARKRGLSKAKGDYVVWVDSDDYITNDYLMRFANEIYRNSPDVVCCGYVIESLDKIKRFPSNDYFFINEDLELLKDVLLYDENKNYINIGSFSVNLWSKAIKTGLAKKYHSLIPNDIRMGDDIAVVVPLLLGCSSISKISNCGYCYQDNPASMSHKVALSEPYNDETLVIYLKKVLPTNYRFKADIFWLYLLRRYLIDIISSIGLTEYFQLICLIERSCKNLNIPKDIYKGWKYTDRITFQLLKNGKFLFFYILMKIKLFVNYSYVG